MQLRPYQQEAVRKVEKAWGSGITRPGLVLATGAGKTVIFSHLIARWKRENPRRQAMVLVHREELADQGARTLRAVLPEQARVGVVKAEQNDTHADVVVGSVDTLRQEKRAAQVPSVGLIVVDECHHAASDSYKTVLGHYGVMDRRIPALGVTATMARGDGKALGEIWDEVVYTWDILDGIKNNPPYLCNPIGYQVTVDDLDLSTVARRQGDMADGSLGEALESSGAGAQIAQACREHASDRSIISFAPTVRVAEYFTEEYRKAGIPTETVVGSTPRRERLSIYDAHRRWAEEHQGTGIPGNRSSLVQAISSVGVLTEGFDAPWSSCAVIGRPTESYPLYVQMAGRVLRLYPRKINAIILDVVGVSSRFELANIADLGGLSQRTPVQDGEDLLSALERQEEEEALEAGKVISRGKGLEGKLASVQVDLFERSRAAWLRTYKGTWFLAPKGYLVYLYPEVEEGIPTGMYSVVRLEQKGTKKGVRLHAGLDVTMAMDVAEGVVASMEADQPKLASRGSRWRRSRERATDDQKNLIAKLRIGVDPRMMGVLLKSEAADLLTVHFASRRLSRWSL